MILKQGDCLNLMKSIPGKSVDMILCDLPYGKTNSKWDNVIPIKELWKQYNRIIKNHGSILLFGAEPFSSALRINNLKMYRYDWIWEKTMATGFPNCNKMPLRNFENISVFYKSLPTYNPQMRKGKYHYRGHRKIGEKVASDTKAKPFFNTNITRNHVIKTDEYYPVRTIKFSNSNHKHYHPTQKPVELLKYLIKTYTNKGNTVLDNCMGSGSTGVACVDTERNFIGYELNKHYFNIAKKRIQNAQQTLV